MVGGIFLVIAAVVTGAVLSQASGAPFDLASLLIFLAGPGASVLASAIVDKTGWFSSLSPNGKLATIAAITLVCALGATGLQQLIVVNPAVGAAADPYVKAALFALSFLSTQFAHGTRTADVRDEGRVTIGRSKG